MNHDKLSKSKCWEEKQNNQIVVKLHVREYDQTKGRVAVKRGKLHNYKRRVMFKK